MFLYSKVTLFMSCALGDFTFTSVSVSVPLRPAVNVMSRCFCWIKPHYVTWELPQCTGWFLSPEEFRMRNTDAKRAKQMKMSPEEATQERALDRERWPWCWSWANDARRNQRVHTDNSHTTSTLIWSTNRTVESSFNHVIQKMKTNAVKALHLTKTDWSKHTNSIHKAIVCLICDCFVMADSSQVSSMSVADIKRHSCRLGIQAYEECQGVALHKDLVAHYTVSGCLGMLLLPQSWKLLSLQHFYETVCHMLLLRNHPCLQLQTDSP